MTVVFYADVSPLSNTAIFEAHFKSVPDIRKSKINRLRFTKSKMLSLGAWIVLKHTLKEFGYTPENAGFSYLANGKPFLANCPDLHISISHSESIAMCAVSKFEVGADVEYVSQFKEGVCRRFFTKSECDYIFQYKNADLQKDRFFRIWTMKESFAKLTGKGIGDLRNFEIDVSSTAPKLICRNRFDSFFFYEPQIPLYKASICLAEEDTVHCERINIIKELLD